MRPRRRNVGGGEAPRWRWRPAVRALALIGLAGIACAACGPEQIRVSSEAGATLFVHDVRGRGTDADIGGYLRYLTEADCFVLETPPDADRTTRHVAVWPPGTEIRLGDGAVAGVEAPPVGLIRLGDWVAGGGGYANPATSELDLPDVSPECLAGGGEFAMLHKISETGSHP